MFDNFFGWAFIKNSSIAERYPEMTDSAAHGYTLREYEGAFPEREELC